MTRATVIRRPYSPVGTASDGDEAFVFLFNPSGATITLNYETQIGSGSFSIPAGDVYKFLMPRNSGAHFFSNGAEPFFALETVGAKPNSNLVHDWGFSLVPEGNLTPELVIGWGPGNGATNGAGEPTPTDAGSPIWVTANGNTTIYVDYDGDGVAPNTAPNGDQYDVELTVAELQVVTTYDPNDFNSTGMRLFTTDGTLITGAWGQDPGVAAPGNPCLDMGTTVLPFPVSSMAKTSVLYVDGGVAGQINFGDTLRYTLTVANHPLLTVNYTTPGTPAITSAAGELV